MKKFFLTPYELYKHGLSPIAVTILAVLANMQGTKKEAWPKQDTLAIMINISKSLARKCITELKSGGYIESKRVGYGRPNHYTLTTKAVDIFNNQCVSTEHSNVSPQDNQCVSTEHSNVSPQDNQNYNQELKLLNKKKNILTDRQAGKIFVFSDEPEDVGGMPKEIQRAMRYCISCSDEAKKDAKDQWDRGWQKWIEISKRGWTPEEDAKVDSLLEDVRNGYGARSLAHIIRARILTD